MSKLSEIYFAIGDTPHANTLYGKIVGRPKPLQKGDFLMLKTAVSDMVFYNHNNESELRVHPDGELPADLACFPNVTVLYFVAKCSGDDVEIRCIETESTVAKPNETLDIAYGDKLYAQRRKSPNVLSQDLCRELTFEVNGLQFIFYQTFNNVQDGERQIRIIGFQQSADIFIRDHKWVVERTPKKTFPRRMEDIRSLKIGVYKQICFKHESEAKAADEDIRMLISSGQAILELWNRYSKYELALATALKKELKVVRYHKICELPENRSRISLDLTESQNELLQQRADVFTEQSFELGELSTLEEKRSRGDVYKILQLDVLRQEAIVEDRYWSLPSSGTFVLSTRGDDRVMERRELVRKRLVESSDLTPLLRNVKFAIEGKADSMFPIQRKPLCIMEGTMSYLRERFGITQLNEKQIEAISIAINTPDIAIIQGPPGTGKSTVIAAICHILSEDSAKQRKSAPSNKCILISAFQNDAVEHTASKVDDMFGLPATKVGKMAKGNPVEDVYIKRLSEKIDGSIAILAPENDPQRVSKHLSNLRCSKDNEAELLLAINSLLQSHPIADKLLVERWRELKKGPDKQDKSKYESYFRSLRTDAASYADDGWQMARALLDIYPDFSTDESDLLKSAPFLDEPSDVFLSQLASLKEKYLSILCSSQSDVVASRNIALDGWIDDAIEWYKAEEHKASADWDTFCLSVLCDIKSDIEDGNRAFIRDGIKNYSESWAATNQIAAGGETRDVDAFENVLLEEAARSNPLDLLIPTLKVKDRIIMVGDQKQLPQMLEPEVKDLTLGEYAEDIREQIDKRMQESLFGLLYENLSNIQDKKNKRVVMLNEQFRMHPEIGDFISRNFYDNELKTAVSVTPESKAHGLTLIPELKDRACIAIDVRGSYESKRSRQCEVDEIIRMTEQIFADPASQNLSVGIISFYRNQVDLLCQAAVKKGWLRRNEEGEYVATEAFVATTNHEEKFRVGTVDSFQGKEFDIVLISVVRSNKKCSYGFLELFNRLNVAFSRAKRLVVAFGDKQMYVSDEARSRVPALYDFFTTYSKFGL